MVICCLLITRAVDQAGMSGVIDDSEQMWLLISVTLPDCAL